MREFPLPEEGRREYSYAVRERFSRLKGHIDYPAYTSGAWVPGAVDLIFLNRTCCNGLFRVNSRGHFTVPAGGTGAPCSVSRATLPHASRSSMKNLCNDPPYRPLTRTARFPSSARGSFGAGDLYDGFSIG